MFEIKNVYGHYEVYMDGKFVGSYDTIVEAAKDIDAIKSGEGVA